MEDHVLHDVLHVVFTNLDYKDLYNASLVNSYWNEVAREENYKRGIVYTTLYKESRMGFPLKDWDEENFQYILKMSSFNLFVINVNYEGPPISTCYCMYQKSTCFSLMLQLHVSYHLVRYGETVSFPDLHKIQIDTITFKKIEGTEFFYCPELRTMSGPYFESPVEMRNKISRYFDNDSPMKSCMILISDVTSANILKIILENLKQWFPHSEISIWCSIIKEIKTCKDLRCRSITDFFLTFISNRSLKVWVTSWSAKYETEEIIIAKLQEFRQRIELKKHSLALIYRSSHFFILPTCLNTQFKTIFRGIPYIFLYGIALITTENFQESIIIATTCLYISLLCILTLRFGYEIRDHLSISNKHGKPVFPVRLHIFLIICQKIYIIGIFVQN